MFVGVARMILSIPGARSLKDKRRVVHSFRDRVRARLNASIAEIGDLERYQVATLGVAVVARDSAHVSELLAEVTHLGGVLREAVLADVATEIVPFGAGGRGIQGGIEQSLAGDAGYGDDEGPEDGEDDGEGGEGSAR
jgi:uncharacterized protein YlxP (DUF503 family)